MIAQKFSVSRYNQSKSAMEAAPPQAPGPHSIHHQFDVYKFNFTDNPIRDRPFGNYMDSSDFTDRSESIEPLTRGFSAWTVRRFCFLFQQVAGAFVV
jgi:hypothetical protein